MTKNHLGTEKKHWKLQGTKFTIIGEMRYIKGIIFMNLKENCCKTTTTTKVYKKLKNMCTISK